MNKNLLSTLLLSTALVTTSVSAEILKPRGDWTVSRIEAGNEKSAAYCVLAREHAWDSIVTIAKNAKEESTLSFETPLLELKPAKTYQVILKAGEEYMSAFDVEPVSEMAVILKLGKDPMFFEAVQAGNAIEIQVEDQVFTFETKDTRGGVDKLDNCIFDDVKVADAEPVERDSIAATGEPTRLETNASISLTQEERPQPVSEESASVEESSQDVAQKMEKEMANVMAKSAVKDTPKELPVEDVAKQAAQKTAQSLPDKAEPEAMVVEVEQNISNEGAAKPNVEVETKTALSEPKQKKIIMADEDLTKLPDSVKKDVARSLKTAQNRTRPASSARAERETAGQDVSSGPSKKDYSQMPKIATQSESLPSMPQGVSYFGESAGKVAQPSTAPTPVRRNLTQTNPAQSDMSAELQALYTQNAQLAAQLEKERMRIEQLKANDSNQAIELAERVTLLTQENVSLRKAVNAAAQNSGQDTQLLNSLERLKVREQELLSMLEQKRQDIQRTQNISSGDTVTAERLALEIERAKERERELLASLEAERQKSSKLLETVKTVQGSSQPANYNSQEAAALAAEVERLRKKLAEANQGGDRAEVAALAAEVERLRAQQQKNNSRTQSTDARPDEVASMAAEIERLRIQNQNLSDTITGLKRVEPSHASSSSASSSEYTQSINFLNQKLADLEKQNKDLSAALTRKGSAPGRNAAVQNARLDTTGLAREVERLRNSLNYLEQENASLNRELDQARGQAENKALNSVKGNVNLERAMIRFQEAERENRRLGALLQDSKQQHQREVEELERLLFDPSITDAAQRERLYELEQQLTVLEQARNSELELAQARIQELESQLEGKQIAQNRDVSNQGVRTISEPLEGQRTARADAPKWEASKHRNVEKRTIQRPQPIIEQDPNSMANVSSGADFDLSGFAEAGINLNGKPQRVSSVSKPNFQVYQWEAGNVYGTTEITKATGSQVFETLYNAYIEKTRRRCEGDFDAVPSDTVTEAGMVAFDIACVMPDQSMSVASLLFEQKNGAVVTYAFESSPDAFEDAMAMRDKLSSSL